MRNLIQAAIELVKNKGIEIQDYLPKNSLKPLNEAIINLHQPNPHSNINEYLIGGASEFRRRVALEEIIANKISYLSVREQNKIKKTHCFSDKKLADQIQKTQKQNSQNILLILPKIRKMHMRKYLMIFHVKHQC